MHPPIPPFMVSFLLICYKGSVLDVFLHVMASLSAKQGGGFSFCLRLLRVPWTARRSNQSTLKEISPGISLEGNDAKAETPVLWPPHAKSWLIGKDSGAVRDWGQEEKGTTEDEMAGWHHWLDGRESQWTSGVGDGQGGLACCDSWGCKESDMTERLIWSEYLRIRSLSLGPTGLASSPSP